MLCATTKIMPVQIWPSKFSDEPQRQLWNWPAVSNINEKSSWVGHLSCSIFSGILNTFSKHKLALL